MDRIVSTLAFCTINDLYWEVKTACIHFWRIFICRQCSQQGMIDGKFPNVTFSIEHKKIITLNEREIGKRIKLILNELSRMGILGIFLTCLNDDCDLEVVKSAIATLKILVESLFKYNYSDNKQNMPSSSSSIMTSPNNYINNADADTNFSEFRSASPKIDNDDSSPIQNSENLNNSNGQPAQVNDDILDSIVDADDVTLLARAYENQMNVDNSDTSSNIQEDYYKKFYVSTDEFLQTILKINLDEFLNSKIMWISKTESFESLLDDIILSFKYLNMNDADCY